MHIEFSLANTRGFEPQLVLNADKYIFNNCNSHGAGTGSWFKLTNNDRLKGSSLAELDKGIYFAAHNGPMPDNSKVAMNGTPKASEFDIHVLCASEDASEKSHKEGFTLWQD